MLKFQPLNNIDFLTKAQLNFNDISINTNIETMLKFQPN